MIAMIRATIQKILERAHFGFVPPPFDAMQNFGRMKFLYDSILAHASRSSGHALEIGCFKGCSTVFLSKACLRKGINDISAVDLFTGTPGWGQTEDTFASAAMRLKDYRLDQHVTLIRSHSLECKWEKPIDVLHIDGDHEYEAVRADIGKYVPFLGDGGIVIFDDYDAAHPGVRQAVHELLLSDKDLHAAAVHCAGSAFGSICLKRTVAPRL